MGQCSTHHQALVAFQLLHEQTEGGLDPLHGRAERALGFVHAVAVQGADRHHSLGVLLLLHFHDDTVQWAAGVMKLTFGLLTSQNTLPLSCLEHCGLAQCGDHHQALVTLLQLHEQAEGELGPLPGKAGRALGFLNAVADQCADHNQRLVLLHFHGHTVQGAAGVMKLTY